MAPLRLLGARRSHRRPGDTASIERLGRYLLRAPVAVELLRFEAGERQLAYQPSSGSHLKARSELFEPADFLARLLQHVPEPRLHQVRYYGHDSNVARARRPEFRLGAVVYRCVRAREGLGGAPAVLLLACSGVLSAPPARCRARRRASLEVGEVDRWTVH